MKEVILHFKAPALGAMLFLLAHFNIFAQCPAPTISISPNPPCQFPIELVASPAGTYTAFKWNTLETTEKITISTGGIYAVTVTCQDGSTNSATRTIKPTFIFPQAHMIDPTLYPCLPGQTVNLQIGLSGLMNGTTIITITASTGEIYVIEQDISGPTLVNFPVSPSVTTTYTLTSVQNTTYGCPYKVIAPKTTTVAPLFESELDFPTIEGNTVFCQNGNTWLEVQSSDPQPQSYLWTPPSPSTLIGYNPVYNATVEGLHMVNLTYSSECEINLSQYVEEDIPEPLIAGGPVCDGQPAVLQTDQPYVSYAWSTGESSPEITISSPGQYRVTITDEYGCTGFDTQTVPAFPSPIASINGPISLCTGQTSANLIVTGANVATYAWSTGETSDQITATGPGEYIVTVTSNQGCTAETSQVIEQVTTPTVSLPSPLTFCEGTAPTLVPTTSSTEVDYQWSTGATTSSLVLTQGGVYRVTVSDYSGECKSTAFALVNMLPAPHPDIQASATALCEGNTANLSLNASAAGYAWSTGSTASNISVTTGGTYQVTVTGSNGCTGTDSQNISLLQQSAPTAIAYLPLCNRSVQLTADPGFNSYQWSNGVSTQSLQTNSMGMYTVTVTNAAGCTNSSAYNVTLLPSAPTPQLSPNGYLCPQGTIDIQPSGSFVSYLWSTGNSTSSISTSQSGIYTVTVTDNNGCTGSTVQMVNTAAVPAPEIAGSLSICNGGATTLSVSGSYSSFLWSTGATTATIAATSSGDYTVTVTSQYGCKGTALAQVVISSFLSPNIAAEPYQCNNVVTLFAGTGYDTYLWSTGATTNTIAVDTPGDYTLTVTNNAGCAGTALQNLAAVPATPPLSIQSVSTFCSNAAAELTASSGFDIYNWNTGEFNAIIAVTLAGTYTVTATDIYGCSKIATQQIAVNTAPSPSVTTEPYACNGLLTLNAGGPYATYHWQDGSSASTLNIFTPGEYHVTVTDAAGCTGTTAVQINEIPERPQVGIQGPNRICTGTTGLLTATPGFNGYEWSNGTSGPEATVAQAGTYIVTATDANNCTSTAQAQIDLLDLPVPVIALEPYNCNGVITLTAGNFETYLWSNGDQTPLATVGASGTYTVTVTDTDGCAGVSAAAVEVPAVLDPQVTLTPQANYSVQLDATPGFSSYLWSNGSATPAVTVHESGTYTVTVTDALGCTASVSVEVLLTGTPMTSSVSINEVTCANSNDGSLGICITGGVAPFTFTITPAAPFQNTITPDCPQYFTANTLAAGTYNWTVTDVNGFTQTGFNTLSNPAPLIATAAVSGNTITAAGSGGEAPYSYSLDGINFQTSPVFNDLPNGAYQVVVLDARGCSSLTPSLLVFTSGTNDITDEWQLQITPNPGDGNFWLQMNNCGADEIQLRILDVAGRLVQQSTVSTGGCHDFRHPINLTAAAAGTYWVEVRTVKAARTVPVVLVR